MLSAYVKDNHRLWDKYLPKVAAAMRSSRSDVTKLTPNFVNFGREVRFLGNSNEILEVPPLSTRDNPTEVSDALEKVFADVKKRLADAYTKSKRVYNLRRRDERFQLNQTVWKRDYNLSDASKHFTTKLAPKFSGPYTITRVLSPWTYELTNSSGRIIGTYHAKDIKAHPPESRTNDT